MPRLTGGRTEHLSGAGLQAHRAHLGLTQEQLARLCGISRGMLADYERGYKTAPACVIKGGLIVAHYLSQTGMLADFLSWRDAYAKQEIKDEDDAGI